MTDEASNTITLRYMTVKVLLSARFEMEYVKGIYPKRLIHVVCDGVLVLSIVCMLRTGAYSRVEET